MPLRIGKLRLVRLLGLLALMALTAAWACDSAHAQATHSHASEVSLGGQEIAIAIAHSLTLWSTVFLAGLVTFTGLVWIPVSRRYVGVREDSGASRLFIRLAWLLFGALVLAGLVELSMYAVSGSGERFTPALLWQALSGTRVGTVWLARLLFAFSTALVTTWALRGARSSYRVIALGLGAVTLMTLTQLSHAAAESRLLPFVADWLHVIAASVWMGGILGFSALLLGPLRTMSAESRAHLLSKAVPRFSRMALVAVTVLLASGIYASLLHLPGFSALTGDPYGRALIMKLGLVTLMLPLGAINLMGRGRGPFGRVVGAELVLTFAVFVATGFLTTITPP